MKEKILESLFEIRCTITKAFHKREDVRQQEQKLEELMNQMKAELTDKQQLLFEKILDVQCDLDSLQNVEYFKQGVQVGMQLLSEVREVDTYE